MKKHIHKKMHKKRYFNIFLVIRYNLPNLNVISTNMKSSTEFSTESDTISTT